MKGTASLFKNQIVRTGEMPPDQVVANALNWRIHPTHQREAVKDALKEIGWISQVIINKRTGNLIDGHLRVDLAMQEGEAAIPFTEVDISEEAERKALATLDPLAALAVADSGNLQLLMENMDVEGEVLKAMLDDLMQSVVDPTTPLPTEPSTPQEFWPRVSFQIPQELYREWLDVMSGLEGEADHEKIDQLLKELRGVRSG